MATREEQYITSLWTDICFHSSNIYQYALANKAAHSPTSQQTLASMKRHVAALMECLEEINGDESPVLPALTSLSCTDQPSPPSSPIALSPSSSPRVPLRTFKEHVTLQNPNESPSFKAFPTSSEPKLYLPPINPHPRDSHSLYASARPLSSSQPIYRGATMSSVGNMPMRHSSEDLYMNSIHHAQPSFVARSFDKNSLSNPPTHPNMPNQHVPRTMVTQTSAIVITKPLTTVCEVPGFKRRGRPSTRIDNQCVECGTTKTPEWRRGEGGVHLCNACGLQYSKRVRREKAEKKRNAITAILNVDV